MVICARGAAAADRPGGRSRKDATKDGAGCSWTDYNEIREGTQPAPGPRPTIGWHNRSPRALISGLTARSAQGGPPDYCGSRVESQPSEVDAGYLGATARIANADTLNSRIPRSFALSKSGAQDAPDDQ